MPDIRKISTGARELKWLLGRYLGFHSRHLFGRDFTPPTLNFLVTLRCDMRCRHCFLWERLEAPGEARDLSLEEIERIAKTTGPLFSLVLSGGEPFLRRDLAEIARVFHAHTGVKLLVILTDGQRPQRVETVVREILSLCPEILIAIGVSLDGIGARHDEIRQRAGAFDRAVQTVRMIKDLSPREPRVSVQTCTVLMGLNEDHIFDLYAFIRDELRPDRVAVNLIRQDALDPGAKTVNPATYGRLMRLIREDTCSGQLRNTFSFDRFSFLTVADLCMGEMIHRTVIENRPQLRCLAGSMSAVLFPDGDVYPCEMKPCWGNLRETGFDFSRFWHAGRRKALAGKDLPGRDCFCSHEINCFLPSIPYNWTLYPRLALQWLRVIRGQIGIQDRPDRLGIVIPLTREESGAGLLLESLAQQSFTNFEVVLVDAAGGETAATLAERFRDRVPSLRVIPSRDAGKARAWNRGAGSTGAVDIVFMEPESRVAPAFLEGLASAMRRRGLTIAVPRRRLPSGDSRFRHGVLFPLQMLRKLLQRFLPPADSPCVAVRREIFEQTGGFDPQSSSPVGLFLRRASRLGRFGVLPEVCVTVPDRERGETDPERKGVGRVTPGTR